MRAAVVGPGRVGTLLAVALTRAGHRVVAVAGGSPASRRQLAELVRGVRAVDTPSQAAAQADLVLLSVPDDAIEAVARTLARDAAVGPGHRVVHLAGSRGLDVLDLAARTGASTAVCHPAMTVPHGAQDPQLLVGTAWAVTARPADRPWAHELVADLGGDPADLRDDVRGLYHAGLAVASNTVGAAVAVARQLLLAAGIDEPRRFLAPLVAASVDNVLGRGATALTGPIVRGDLGTITSHLDALERDLPELARAYRALSGVVLEQVAPSLDPAVAAELARLLAADADAPLAADADALLAADPDAAPLVAPAGGEDVGAPPSVEAAPSPPTSADEQERP